ncbi:MAG: pyridoxamine 5'-phosphate oxidase family protein [Gemmatales bacterium]
MNSINRNQPEHNEEHLTGQKAIQKIQELIKVVPTCFFCTPGARIESRPMSVRQADDQGNLWFLSSRDSSQNEALSSNPSVTLYFQGSSHTDFLVLKCNAEILIDKAKLKELWEPLIKTWFTEGIDDPRITILKLKAEEGYYWATKHGSIIVGIKMMIGAMLGKTMDDSIEGRLKT